MIDHAKELRRFAPVLGKPTIMLDAADEIERLAAKLEAAEKSDAESIAMYRRVRDERDDWITKAEAAHRDYNALEGYYTELAEKLAAAEKAVTKIYQRGKINPERAAALPTRITPEQALNMAINAGEHLRKYLPNDEFLTEADRMAVVLLEKAKRFERGE